MPLPAGWSPPNSWSGLEEDIFKKLQRGDEADYRSAAAKATPAAVRAFVPDDTLQEITGAFLSEIIRRYMDEFPLGIQIYGVRITGKINIPDVRITKVIAIEHCYVEAPIVATDCRFITFSLIGSVMRRSIDLRGSSIEGSLFLRQGFRSEEALLLRDMRITGSVDCKKSAFFYNKNGTLAADLEDTVKGECFSFARSSAATLMWSEMKAPPEGIINLRNCKIGSLRDDIDTPEELARDWPKGPCLRIAGLKYDERTTTDPARLAAWLSLQKTDDPEEKQPSAYQAAIKSLLDNGQDLSADKLILAKHRLLAKNDSSCINKAFRHAYIWLSDAGVNTSRIFIITVIFIAISTAIVAALDYNGLFEPKSVEVLKSKCYTDPKNCKDDGWRDYGSVKLPSYYSSFNPLGYTLDISVPLLKFGTSDDWRPVGQLASWITILIRVIGTVCWGLVGFCLSGLARYSR